MSEPNGKEIATQEKPTPSLTVGKSFSLTPTTLTEAIKLAELIATSDLAPKDFKGKPGNCLIAMQMGMEVGLAPMMAIQNIAVINGRPTVWGDAAIGLVLASAVCSYVREEWDEKSQTWTIRGKRKDDPNEGVYTFSMADAVKAGLSKKEGPWTNYPKRMIQMRARAFLLRDKFADVLKGLAVREEVEDYIDTTAEPTAPIMTPKPMETPAIPADGTAVLLPGEYSFFKTKMNSLGADWKEVEKCAKAKFGLTDLSKLTKDQAKEVIGIWEAEPPAAA